MIKFIKGYLLFQISIWKKIGNKWQSILFNLYFILQPLFINSSIFTCNHDLYLIKIKDNILNHCISMFKYIQYQIKEIFRIYLRHSSITYLY